MALATSSNYIRTQVTQGAIEMVVSRNPDRSDQTTSDAIETADEQTVAAELDLILARLEEGIPLENRRMDALLSRLRTTLIAA
jgi:hypothetical protein